MSQEKIRNEDIVSLDKSKVGLGSVSNDAQLKIASNLSDVNNKYTSLSNLRDVRSGTFASGSTTYVMTDANVTANSIIDVYAQSTPIGAWSVSSSAGQFTITSTKTETSNVAFKYFINNV